MPGVKRRAHRGAGISRRRLHEHVLPFSAAFQRLDQESVEHQAPGETEVLAFARHRDYGLLHRALNTCRNLVPQTRWNGSTVIYREVLVEARAEPAVTDALAVEIRPVASRPTVVKGQQRAEQPGQPVTRGCRHPLYFVLVGAAHESKQLRDS